MAIRDRVTHMAYDPDRKRLTVKTSAAAFVYFEVPPHIGNFLADIFETSEAEFAFSRLVESRYRYERIRK